MHTVGGLLRRGGLVKGFTFQCCVHVVPDPTGLAHIPLLRCWFPELRQAQQVGIACRELEVDGSPQPGCGPGRCCHSQRPWHLHLLVKMGEAGLGGLFLAKVPFDVFPLRPLLSLRVLHTIDS